MDLPVPDSIVFLAVAVAVVGFVSLAVRGRGGRFRTLPMWAGFWIGFGLLLIMLSLAPRWISMPLLAAVMFASLRTYFFVAPMRLKDRYSVLLAYATIPLILWPVYVGNVDLFFNVVPVTLFLVFPAVFSIGHDHSGLLDSMGRGMLGVLFFLYCGAYLGLMTHLDQGVLPLFGILVLSAELPQRMAGGRMPGRFLGRLVLGALIAGAIGYLLARQFGVGDWVGLNANQVALGAAFISLAVTMAHLVTNGIATDLEMNAPSTLMGRGVFLGRIVPAVYAAPFFYYYLILVGN